MVARDEEQPVVGSSPMERRVMNAVEDFLENCAQVIVDIEVVESLLRPENPEVSPRYVLRHSTRRGSKIFQLFDTSEKPNHFEASRRRYLESQGETVHGKKVGKTSDMTLCIKEPRQKLRRALTALYKTREEEDQWVVMEDRRRRRIAFENLAKEMLRYLDNGHDVKVGITELQGRLKISEKVRISVRQVAQQAMNENGQKVFEVFWQQEEEVYVAG